MELKLKKKFRIRTSLDTYDFMGLVLNREILETPIEFDLDKEHFWCIGLNRAYLTINLELVALGSNSQVVVNPVEVFGLPIYKSAERIILVHNHPSGNLKPSEEDRNLTDRLIQCGRILQTTVWDHVIITEHSYYSFQDSGLLECLSNSIKYVPPYKLEEQFHQEMQKEVRRLKHEAREKLKLSLQKGIKQGMQQGLEKGKLQIARSMLSDKEPMEKIIKWTGLSKETIEQLLEK